MKKIYLSIFTAISVIFSSNAQTLTATNHNPLLGEIIKTTECSTTAINPGTSGTNQTYNFGAITIGTVNLTNTVVTSASTGSAASYPSSSVAISSGTNNSYYTPTTTDLKFWGGNMTIGALNVVLTYTSNAVYAVYPMAYNTTNTVSVGGGINVSGNNGTFTGISSIVADGTGTLVLPGRTFNNILRVKNVQNLNFNLIVSGTVNQILYEYYDPTLSKNPILTVTNSTLASIAFGTSTLVAVTVNTDYLQVGVKESLKELTGVNIFPNPANTNVNIQLNGDINEAVNLEIINAIGQNVRKEILTNKSNLVNVSELPSGIYFFKMSAGNAVTVKKITIE